MYECVCGTVHVCLYVPVNSPGGHVVRNVSSVCLPVSVGQLFDLHGEVPQWGGAWATCHPVEAEAARFNSILRSGQFPGWLWTLYGFGKVGERRMVQREGREWEEDKREEGEMTGEGKCKKTKQNQKTMWQGYEWGVTAKAGERKNKLIAKEMFNRIRETF